MSILISISLYFTFVLYFVAMVLINHRSHICKGRLKALSRRSRPGTPQRFHANAPNSIRAGQKSADFRPDTFVSCDSEISRVI